MKISALLLIFFTAMVLEGCGFRRSSEKNILVVAIEGLGFERVPCQSENLKDGFATLCEESIRFTHAYANSTGSLPNLATLLTGEFPWDHGLRGQTQWLRPHRETVAEKALNHGLRTLFVSSGLPMLSKSGLNQGFENFDDRIDLFNRPRFRPASQVVERFLNWVDGEEPQPFFGVLHFSDLLFPYRSSKTAEGELRDLSINSQLEEISEELGHLITALKKRGQWNSTFLAVVGLSGGGDPSSLKSKQTQVTLMIKPSRLKKDQGTSWGVDFNVSLADLGVTLNELVTGQLPQDMNEKTSLKSVFYDPTPSWDRDRLIRTEMYWSFENFGLDVVQSLRNQSFFYVHQNPPLLYNTLTDRQEISPLTDRNGLSEERFGQFRDYFEKLGLAPAVLVEVPSWFYVGVEGFRKEVWPQSPHLSFGSPLRGWNARKLIEEKRWGELAKNFKDEPLIHFVAQSKLSESGSLVQEGLKEKLSGVDCGVYFFKSSFKNTDSLSEHCRVDRLLQFLDWERFKGSDEELFYESQFRWSYQLWWSRLELGAMNYAAFGNLGVPLSWPKAPDVSELFLIHNDKKIRNRNLMHGFTSHGKYQL